MTPDVRRRAARGDGAQLRDEVLAAAEELMLGTGSDEAVSIRDIAKRVGVTAPSIYRHFADKHALIIAVCAKQFAEFNSAMDAAVAGVTDPLEELRIRGAAYIDFGLRHPEAYVVMFMRPPVYRTQEEATDVGADAFGEVVGAVRRAIEAGAMSHDDPFRMAQVIWASVHGLVSLMIAKPDFPWSDVESLKNDLLDSALALYVPGR